MPSVSGARYLASLGITAQMIYIDGSHIEGDVIRDLDLYWDRLAPGGVMLVDDYVPHSPDRWLFEGVIRDVQKFASQRGLKLEADGNKARLWKPKV
jgi:predicted O-methyltransferase YrrM